MQRCGPLRNNKIKFLPRFVLTSTCVRIYKTLSFADFHAVFFHSPRPLPGALAQKISDRYLVARPSPVPKSGGRTKVGLKIYVNLCLLADFERLLTGRFSSDRLQTCTADGKKHVLSHSKKSGPCDLTPLRAAGLNAPCLGFSGEKQLHLCTALVWFI